MSSEMELELKKAKQQLASAEVYILYSAKFLKQQISYICFRPQK